MLNLSFVRTFVTLIETGSFSDTARRLEMAQPTVSQHLKKLETLLGVMLSLIHISEPTRLNSTSRMPSSA